MGLLDWMKGGDPAERARREFAEARQSGIKQALQDGRVPPIVAERLDGARTGKLPWVSTLTPAELMITRTHGIRPVAAVSATCWMHYGWSWTEGHAQGWESALNRLKSEAKAAGANAVLDVKMRSLSLETEDSMDFTLVGTAVRIEGLPPSSDPVIATVPALEFVRLLDADVVPTGIAIGANYEWFQDSIGSDSIDRISRSWTNQECQALSDLWRRVRQQAHTDLRQSAGGQGNGVLAHVNFSQTFRSRQDGITRYLARHIIVATTVDVKKQKHGGYGQSWQGIAASATDRKTPLVPFDIQMVVDMNDKPSNLDAVAGKHHQSYTTNDEEGAI